MHRFFVDRKKINDNIAIIDGDDFKHLNKVLRLKIGEEISISDGRGLDYIGIISDIVEGEAIIDLKEEFRSKGESNIDINLYQGVPKADKMEMIIQKSVEIGVKEIIPVQFERSVSKIEKGKKAQKKIERWQKISESAAKQSFRGIIPKIDRVLSFKELLAEIEEKEELIIVFYENEKEDNFKELIKNYRGRKISIIIGPEGGFSQREIEELKKINVKSVSLGNRILRTETVSLVASSIIMYELGDLGEI